MSKYISALEAAQKWNLKRRRITDLCSAGRIPGAELIGNSWVIPADAKKPPDARIKSGKYAKDPSELKRKKRPQGKVSVNEYS